VRLSHRMAAPPSLIFVQGRPAAESCDAEPLPSVDGGLPVIIDWAPVTHSHPTIGKLPPRRVDIVRYQFFVEQAPVKLAIDLSPDVTEFEVPPALVALGGTFKFEIIARTATGNNTAIESGFVVK
jgi:hypothetical protein